MIRFKLSSARIYCFDFILDYHINPTAAGPCKVDHVKSTI